MPAKKDFGERYGRVLKLGNVFGLFPISRRDDAIKVHRRSPQFVYWYAKRSRICPY
jgi:hypothetical protein